MVSVMVGTLPGSKQVAVADLGRHGRTATTACQPRSIDAGATGLKCAHRAAGRRMRPRPAHSAVRGTPKTLLGRPLLSLT